ncbi:MAG: T9SS type A sorting domain-containing protein [Ferruginibacter sp.]|nr:T9SS type A sorting domain-containing protein [Ferruginibacter sp.]
MAFIRKCIVITMALFGALYINAQTVRYPVQSSRTLKETAGDIAMLMQKAVSGSSFTTGSYTTLPQSGFIFIYDSTINSGQACRVECDGSSFIKFSAAEDNGLCFGIYQYLQQIGFRFYLPGTIWETIPALATPYKKIDSIYTFNFKYNGWYLSGGHNRWVMDNDNNYGWESYFGLNGHNWSLYQRRNGMTGEYRFAGHRSDIISGSNLSTWQNNPCYIASFNNSRAVNSQSVPDVNNTNAKDLWASIIEQKYTAYRNGVFNNSTASIDQLRNYKYSNYNIGIEVTDGAHWGNTKDNSGCINSGYAKESDQSITLANHTAQKIGSKYPNAHFQVYAYSTHADVPSANISLNEKLDIQLIPKVYQNLTSTNGLRNRWYNRTKNISEYNYLNLSGWSGETPSLDLDALKATLQIAKDKKSQGLMWEASPAKFASLPFLLAANQNLKNDIPVDSTLVGFCNSMFAGAGKTIYSLLQLWADENRLAGGVSNMYKLPLYFQLINEADQLIAQEPAIVKERLRELKAYLHYTALYYDWAGDQGTGAKTSKAATLCLYLAKINKLQLVNSYYLISTVTRGYANTSSFYQQYNVANGTAYQNGHLPLITAAEIENDFSNDLLKFTGIINKYKFETTDAIAGSIDAAGLRIPAKVNVQLGYTNGMDYYNRCEFSIKAPSAGTFTIDYKPVFEMAEMGYINFTVESTERTLEIIQDFSLDRNAKDGSLTINLPAAGNYKLTVCSKYKSSVSLSITTNKNIFYKSGTFFGRATESYTKDTDKPGYIYIPAGIDKLYFSLGNSNAGGAGFKNEAHINTSFGIYDINGKILKAKLVTPNDSALFYIDIPHESVGKFIRIIRKYYQYSLVFSNVNNYLWYAEPKPQPCKEAGFTIDVINRDGHCVTQLRATAKSGQLNWTIVDNGNTYTLGNEPVIELPDYISQNAEVTLTKGEDCSFTKKLADDETFVKNRQACSLIKDETIMPAITVVPVVYPNPSTGSFRFMQNGSNFTANQVFIMNTQGNTVALFNNTKQVNIGYLPAGIYWYKIVINKKEFTGKLVKL